jgi:hypothetical protein
MRGLNLEKRIDCFARLGKQLSAYQEMNTIPEEDTYSKVLMQANIANPWFTWENSHRAFKAITTMLEKEKLTKWLNPYKDILNQDFREKKIGVVMAGNIPLVGFHDYLCVLISGHRLIVKLSSQDIHLLPFIHQQLCKLDPWWTDRVEFRSDQIGNVDAIIATGSTNTSRYFQYYFRNIPQIIRKSRSSTAILTGNETEADLGFLAADVMYYFGLGCRNVSMLLLPEDYSYDNLKSGFNAYFYYLDQQKFKNNYDYYRAVFLINKKPFIELGPIMLIPDNSWSSPVSVLHYRTYTSRQEVISLVQSAEDRLQCVVSIDKWPFLSIMPGKTHIPEPWDYADNIDTILFLQRGQF